MVSVVERAPQLRHRRARLVLALSAVPWLAVIALAQLPSWYPGELATHWTLHAALLMLPGWLATKDDARWGRVFLFAVVLALLPFLRAAYAPRAAATLPAVGQAVVMAEGNLYFWNHDRAGLRRALLAQAAAVIGLAEIVPSDRAAWLGDPAFPFQVWQDSHGKEIEIALLSRHRILNHQVHDLGGVHAIDALLDLGDGPLRVVMLHLSSPTSAREWRNRDRELRLLAGLLADIQEPLVVLGDFNITIADPMWPVLLASAGLRTAAGHEPASWPNWLGPCGIAIDHILVRDAAIDGLRAFTLPGSDHRGLCAELAVPAAR
jgi:endonuclease/exonuclease/phosphatase (EEP) superfamily protein YafD